jgi:DNA repair protein RecO (recombination protein O)
MERSHAILIRLTKLTDTSLIVHWFTADHGIIKTVAKGARNPKSPFAGQLDLFFGAEISWISARTGELHSLREVQVTECREAIRGEYNAMLLSAYCCRLFELLIERDHPEPELFDLLKRALDHVATDGASSKALRHFEHETARILGLSHERKQAAPVLREMLGSLPPQREQLLERLSGKHDFPFSERDSGD